MSVFIVFDANFESYQWNIYIMFSFYLILSYSLNVQYKYLFEKNKPKNVKCSKEIIKKC